MENPATASSADLIARLDRIPIWPYPRWILVVVGAGFFSHKQHTVIKCHIKIGS